MILAALASLLRRSVAGVEPRPASSTTTDAPRVGQLAGDQAAARAGSDDDDIGTGLHVGGTRRQFT